MKLNVTRCQVCAKEMSLGILKPTEGEVHDVRVQIDGMPVMRCPEGHKRFVAPDFAVKLVDALLQDDRLAAADPALQKGLLRKRYHCPGCSGELDGNRKSRLQAARSLDLEGLGAFGVYVELPRFHCASCGRDCVPPGEVVVGDLIKASARAFRAAEVSAT